jgi:myosin-5
MSNIQIGKTKVFLRAGQMAELDARRTEVLSCSASKIQRKVRSFLARKNFIQLRMSSVQLQAMCRGTFSPFCIGKSIIFQSLIFMWR